ncbi:hypothetical protein HBI56_158440 [Parastagonospora nodorum]|uniref:Phytocyanin domain-containing protein n=2 Tax=Phaeosphaeria nodorum (strain SN15 / ATCC MYA-4574 / FGSC 10173) TaxID=321614 RepID=A0A7U2ESL2_PHANO|nr:hypothetical protein SNOG_02439 [Parastagonospora nodorum SN15]KAH3907449.1 hypothetical protein HBH56_189160 [Parastagonospora nodorum]EAT90651.1 hypothetical protein SNOG_02439 [Parastagonospora nodorum SN15]KAH3925223.1 hypothetical protein HBH54_184970 [Parastagonospora nodorum]KAH3954236.1 hypothetical protein HBH53_024320 [Parastagonospora nodorum]KAH3963809.1 hypothetical protein HBH51_164160 [Parastagonospora nodorum]
MYFSRSTIVSALMGLATAQSSLMASEAMLASSTASASGSLSTGSAGSGSLADTTTPSGMVNTHIINVGGPNGSLIFSPSNIRAAVGDMIQFHFYAKNHSVAQSTFDQPCMPIANVMSNMTTSFYSGFMPTNATFGTTSNVLTYTIPVRDEKPIWFYCSQGRHCQNGMVGAINAPASGNRTMAAFTALAAQASENISPGQAAGSGSGSGAGGAGGSSPSGTTPGNTPIAPSGNAPAQQSANAAPVVGSQSVFGLGAAAVAAFAML